MFIERFVSSREPRLMAQALRLLGPLRKASKESPSRMVAALSAASAVYAPTASTLKSPLADVLASLPKPTAEELASAIMPPPEEEKKEEKADAAKAGEADKPEVKEEGKAEGGEAKKEGGDKEKAAAAPAEKKLPARLPESEMLIALLALLLLLDSGKAQQAMPWSLQLMERVAALKRRTLDPIAEKIYFYASWAFESAGQLAALRSPLLAAHRTAMLHHNTTCQ